VKTSNKPTLFKTEIKTRILRETAALWVSSRKEHSITTGKNSKTSTKHLQNTAMHSYKKKKKKGIRKNKRVRKNEGNKD
jgi:hypothetical protein